MASARVEQRYAVLLASDAELFDTWVPIVPLLRSMPTVAPAPRSLPVTPVRVSWYCRTMSPVASSSTNCAVIVVAVLP